MKKFAWILLITGSLNACSKDAKPAAIDAAPSGPDATSTDAAMVDATTVEPDAAPDADPLIGCNPLAAAGAQGCATGQKCTWIEIQDSPDTIGMLGCVPDGSVALDGACTRGAVGPATGYDNCEAGGICIGSGGGAVCKDVCGFDGGATSACAVGSACTRYSGLGANGDEDPVIGACNPTCDPLKQTRIVNGVTESCGVNQGCYLLASTVDTVAVCAGAGTPTHNQPITGTTYANSCAPGHVPRQAVQGVAGNECTALCKPADVYMGMNEAYEGGNSTETNFANLPATCESAGGATVAPGVPVTGESCTFYWTREPATNLTNFSNTLGWCFNHAAWKYDPDGMDPINNTADYPRCPTLTTGDVVPPVDPVTPHNDAQYFGCTALPVVFQAKPAPKRGPGVLKLDRLGSYKQ